MNSTTYYDPFDAFLNTEMKAEAPFFDTDLQPVFDATPVPMALSRPDGSFEYVNPALMNMLGYTEQECYSKDLILSHPDELPINRQIRQSLLEDPFTPITIEKRYLHKSGKSIPALLTIVAQPNAQGAVQRFIAQIVSLEKQKQTENALQLFRTLIQQSNDAMFVVEARTGRLLDVNEAAMDSLGYSLDELLTKTVMDIEETLSTPDDWQRMLDIFRRERKKVIEGRHLRKDGQVFPVEVSVSYTRQDDNEYLISLARDLTERKQSEAIIWQQANFDSLTNLPNRWLFANRLQESISRAATNHQRLAVMSLDLDYFKQVNDTYGHLVGDQLLVKTAGRIQSCLRGPDIAARVGGDEFTIILPMASSLTDINLVAANLVDVLNTPFEIGQKRIYISASIGIAVYPDDAGNADGLMKNSDQALYSAKQNGKNRYRYFTPSMQRVAERKNRVQIALRECLANNQLSLVYQPIVGLQDGKLAMAETLLRWNHPEMGFVSPQEFISVAEENSTICDIGDWVFTNASRAFVEHEHQLPSDFALTINSSPVQFRNNNMHLLMWCEVMKKYPSIMKRMVIEITEGVTMDLDGGSNNILNALRREGFGIAVDDFGTGYSSLTYLRRFNVDYLKIDKEFVAGITTSAEDLALCEAMIVMAHKLKLKVIAEGVECAEQARVLTDAGCDYGQGYYYSRPTSLEALIQQHGSGH